MSIPQTASSTEAAVVQELAIGKHRYKFRAPRRVTLVFGGKFSIAEAREIVRLFVEAGDRHGPLCIGVDVSGFQPSGPHIRRVFAAADGRQYRVRAAAIWGTNYTTRTIMSMVIRAAFYFEKDLLAFPVEFFRTEAEANAWFDGLET